MMSIVKYKLKAVLNNVKQYLMGQKCHSYGRSCSQLYCSWAICKFRSLITPDQLVTIFLPGLSASTSCLLVNKLRFMLLTQAEARSVMLAAQGLLRSSG